MNAKLHYTRMKYWFKRKTYGYGWTPTTWQGWCCTAGFMVLIIAPIGFYPLFFKLPYIGPKHIALFLIYNLILSLLFFWISWKKGERPTWQWGKKPK
jgi:hypothetical protein